LDLECGDLSPLGESLRQWSWRMTRTAIAIVVIGFMWLEPCTIAADPAKSLLGKSAEQWQADLQSLSASQRHLAAWALAQMPNVAFDSLLNAIQHDDPVVRYWAVQGIARRPAADAADQVAALLADKSPSVRVAAAEACMRLDRAEGGLQVLAQCLIDPQDAVRIQAIASLERLGPKAAPLKAQIEQATGDTSEYVKRISTRLLTKLP
jgi:HEAT repeat protein